MSRPLAALMLLTLGSVALAQVRPVATFSFDQDLNGSGATGPIVGTPEGKPVLAPGRVGQALQTGPTFGWMNYPSIGIINPLGGTVEMWVCANDWESGDGKFHTFFECKQAGALYLYQYWNSKNLLMLTCADLAGPYASAQTPTDFKPGVWHHLAGTWSPDGVQIYYDGKPAGQFPVSGDLPAELGATFAVGDQPWQFERTTSSLVDEVRIYDRPLTPAHIAAHYAGNYDLSLPLNPETARLSADIDPDAYTVSARFDTVGADVADAQLSVALGLVAQGQPLPADTPAKPALAGQVTTTVAFPSRAPGKYDLIARVLVEGKQSFETRKELVIPSTEWLGNKLGLEDKVLPPWTPLSTSGTDVSCWGRRYSFRSTQLPVQVTSAGAELLARPITWRLTSGGKPVAWRDQSVKLLSASATKAELQATAGAPAGNTTVRFSTTIKAEYDGLVLFETTCTDPDKLPLDSLSLEIPVKADRALYRHRYASSWIPTSGFVPEGKGVVEKTKWVPFAWLGDNDRGLFAFTEDDRAWPNSQSENAIEIAREGQEIILRFNLLAKGQKLPPDWKFVWGLQATPVKPIPKDWRKWRMSGNIPMARQNVEIVWPNANKQDSLRAFGWPEAADPATFAALIKAHQAAGVLQVPYLCLTYLTGDTPEWQFFKKRWVMGPSDPSIPEAGWKHTFEIVSPNGQGYSDFIMWKTKQFLEQYRIDGVYHDQTHPYMGAAPQAGVGYMRDGKACLGTPILGYRALYRRNYAIVKSLPYPTFTQAHMSGKMTIPILGYEDSYLDGEHFRGVVKDNYLDVMTLDSFRCEYMGRQWGIMPFFLPEFDDENRPKVEPTRGLMALLMLHDTNIWPIWCNTKVVDDAFKALDAFGYVDSEFIPYFDPFPPATTTMPDVYISAYKKADGNTLLVIANLSHEERSGPVHVNLKRLGLLPIRALSWPEKTTLNVRNSNLDLSVPGLGYRLVVLQK